VKIILLLLFCNSLYSQTVDTVRIYSSSMQQHIPCVIIKPLNYDQVKSHPVVYLLHGYSGKHDNWINKVPALKTLATFYNLIIVCPDGGYSSWYVNSPINRTSQLETFIAVELIKYIDKQYKTIAQKKARAITGLSMGGHGALYIGVRNSHIFGAIGSISGVVDLSAVKNKYEINRVLGDTIQYARNWFNSSAINLFDSKKKINQKMIIDCGSNDQLIESNRLLHKKLLQLKIPHEYLERIGKHDWKYWSEAIPYQLYFFRKYFNGS